MDLFIVVDMCVYDMQECTYEPLLDSRLTSCSRFEYPPHLKASLFVKGRSWAREEDSLTVRN